MVDPQPDNPAPDAWRFNMRAFLVREWPYLLVLILALFGVGYTSFSKTPITTYWIVLAPFIGLICVITRWRDAENREQRLRLIWTQALHWAAVLVAMRLMYVADVSRMMNADASALAALTVLALGTFTAGVRQHGASARSASCWRLGSGHRMARAINAAPSVDCGCRRGGHCTIFLASQMVGSTSSRIMRDCCTAGYRPGP